MTKQISELDPKTRALLNDLQAAYRAKGTSIKGQAAERYHQALAAYVAHLKNRNGEAPVTLTATLAWYDAMRGAVSKDATGQMTKLL